MKKILSIDPSTYTKHSIHGEGRIWGETNCYSDLLIEQLHALGHDPSPALSFTLRADFEGDQWTFFKFPHNDLIELYGVDIQELAVWRPLISHIDELIKSNKPAIVELDSYFLPDTSGTAYKIAHVKSSVSVNELDLQNKKMGYFHNSGYYELSGDDFSNIFQLDGLVHERMLPPYFEFIKREYEIFLKSDEMLKRSLSILKRNISLIPKKNPFHVFKDKFSSDLSWLMNSEVEVFHAYSFATLRQFGACFELTSTYFEWLSAAEKTNLQIIIDPFKSIAETSKSFQFQLARSMARKKTLDLSPLDQMAEKWESSIASIKDRYLE